MSKKLHPALIPDHGMAKPDTSPDGYEGGSINPFGITLEISWNKKENTWEISSPHVINSHELIDALTALYQLMPDAFSDESEVQFGYIMNKVGVTFWDKDGQKYIVGSNGSAIHVDRENKASGKIIDFSYDEKVYIDSYLICK